VADEQAPAPFLFDIAVVCLDPGTHRIADYFVYFALGSRDRLTTMRVRQQHHFM
jgi:hypothetical protein